VRDAGVAVRLIGTAAVLWRPGDAMLWQLNPVARAAWALMEDPISADEIAELMAELFPDVGQDRLRADIARLLGQLAAAGLITACDGAGPLQA
jgi:hypothetical protein